jgi:hypothetical protein
VDAQWRSHSQPLWALQPSASRRSQRGGVPHSRIELHCRRKDDCSNLEYP